MSNPLSGVLNKARTSLGGPLAGFQGPQTMQMPTRRPMPMGGGMPSMPSGPPAGMLPQSAVSAPPMGGGMPAMPMGGGMPAMPMGGGMPAIPMGGASGAFGPQTPGNTGIVPPRMRRGPGGSALSAVLRKMRPDLARKMFGAPSLDMPGDMPSMPHAAPGAALA